MILLLNLLLGLLIGMAKLASLIPCNKFTIFSIFGTLFRELIVYLGQCEQDYLYTYFHIFW